jgi:hypothetical protein
VGDFNSTETLSTFDIGGPLAPSRANVEVVQTLFSKWRFKDLWTREDNDSRETKRNLQEHLTHWNHEHIRDHIDRVYANFVIEVKVMVTTFHHPGSDHKGVLYMWSAQAPFTEEPPLPLLPYRAFELKEVKAYNKAILQDYVENHLEGINAFSKWDKAKRLICTYAIETWSKKVRARGRHLKVIAKRYAKLRIDLHCMPINH